MTTTIALNPVDFENITAVLGPPPPMDNGVAVFVSAAEVEPGHIRIADTALDPEAPPLTVPLSEFDPVAGALLQAIAEYGVEAIGVAPGGFTITQGDAVLLVTYSNNEAAIAAAESLGVPINQASELGALDMQAALDSAQLPDPGAVAALAHEHLHPETLTEHGGEG